MAIIGDSFFIMQKQIACRFINLNILLIIFNTIFRELKSVAHFLAAHRS